MQLLPFDMHMEECKTLQETGHCWLNYTLVTMINILAASTAKFCTQPHMILLKHGKIHYQYNQG